MYDNEKVYTKIKLYTHKIKKKLLSLVCDTSPPCSKNVVLIENVSYAYDRETYYLM